MSDVFKILQLKLKLKVKFKRRLADLKRQQMATPSIVFMHPEAQSLFDGVDMAIKRSADIEQIFDDHFNSIDDHVSSFKATVDEEIEAVIATLQDRKKTLHQKVCDSLTQNRIFRSVYTD